MATIKSSASAAKPKAPPPRPAEEEETRAVAVVERAPPPAFLQEHIAEDAGKGVSKDQSDNLLPLVYVLQAQSPQVNERNPKYIEGAKAGAIWLRGFSEEIQDGEEGIIVQPCVFSKCWIEWVDRDEGGGFVGRHDSLPSDAEKVEDPKNKGRVRYVSKNTGHQYVETREHVVLVHVGNLRVPYVIPMSGSNHRSSRAWMFMMNNKVFGEGTAPSWAGLYRLKTEYRTNAAGEWFAWDVHDEGWVQSNDDYARGKALHEAFSTGERQVDASGYGDLGDESDESGDADGDDGRP